MVRFRGKVTNHDDIYSAVMTEDIARVHSVHLVDVEQLQAAADPQTKPLNLGCESVCLGNYRLQRHCHLLCPAPIGRRH